MFSLPLSSFNCEQFHSLRTYRTSELELELIIRILRDTECYTRANLVSKTQNPYETEQAFTNQNSVRIPSLFTYIELKVSSGSVLTTRASPVFKV